MYPVAGIAITGHGEEQLDGKLGTDGFRRHIMKPVQFADLLSADDEAAAEATA